MPKAKQKKAPKRKKRAHRRLKAVVLLVAALLLASDCLVTYAIGRVGDGTDRESLPAAEQANEIEARMIANHAAQAALTESFEARVEAATVRVTSGDGLWLAGRYYENPGSHRWAIVIHGYHGSSANMTGYAQRYYDAGYQVLAPDLRASGGSEGRYLGMGWLDRADILAWIDCILQWDPEARIVLHGISMGAATVMMTAGETTPDAVCAFVEDCGYTSVWDIFALEMREVLHLPVFPLLYTANAVAQVRAGYDFHAASAVEQVTKCEKPMLFIHGNLDDFVPFEMMQTLYDAKPGENKQMLVAAGAGHGQAALVLGEEYWAQVFAFLKQYGM